MKLSIRLLIAAGMLGLMVAPAFVNAVGVTDRCVSSVSGVSRSCKIITDQRLLIFAGGLEGRSVTVEALATIDGVERRLATCSYSGSETPEDATITPPPGSIRVEVEVSPAPTTVPTIRETIEPGAITTNVIPNSGPGSCSSIVNTDPGIEVKCIASGAIRRGMFGCAAYENN